MLFTKTAETACIGCWLMPPALIFDWFMFHYWAGSVLIMPFIAAYFNELVSSSTLTPPSCHSARRVYPELQNPLLLKSEGKPSPSREKGLWRWSSHTPWESILSRSMDSATSPSAPRRMTGMGDILWKVKVFGLEKPSIRESGAMRIGCWCRAHWLLMLCALMLRSLVVDTVCIGCWGSVHWLLIL